MGFKCPLLKNNIKLRSISSSTEYLELRNNDPLHYLLIEFTRVCFNNHFDKGFFTLSVMATPSSGKVFSILLEKANKKWGIKKVIESGIVLTPFNLDNLQNQIREIKVTIPE